MHCVVATTIVVVECGVFLVPFFSVFTSATVVVKVAGYPVRPVVRSFFTLGGGLVCMCVCSRCWIGGWLTRFILTERILYQLSNCTNGDGVSSWWRSDSVHEGGIVTSVSLQEDRLHFSVDHVLDFFGSIVLAE